MASSSAAILRCVRQLSTAVANANSSANMTISQAKSLLLREHDCDKALDIYSTIKSNHTATCFSTIHQAQLIIVRLLAKSHRFSDIESLMESHKTDPRITNEYFLSSLIKSYGIVGMFDHAFRTYNQMETLKTPRSCLSFNGLLSACVNSKQFDRVPQLFDEMPAKYGFKPDNYSYGLLVKSYCEAGKPELAIDKLKELGLEDLAVYGFSYTSVIHALYKNGNSTEAERVWDEMVNKGCVIDVAAYNVRLMNMVDGDPEKIKAVIEEMRNAGLKPDTISYNYLMSCYCKKGMVNEAKEVFDKLEENGCKPNAALFTILVYHLCLNEQFETGYKVFQQSVAVNKIPGSDTLKLLVTGLAKKSRTDEVECVIRNVKKKFPPSILVDWTKFEKELFLVSTDTEAANKPGFNEKEADSSASLTDIEAANKPGFNVKKPIVVHF